MESNIKPIFFFSTPNLNEFCALTTGFSKSHDRNYQHMITSCRKIIWSEPTILASPNQIGYYSNCVLVIVRKEYAESRGFKSSLKKAQLDTLGKHDVTEEEYQIALKYTILAKMSPKWCTVDNYLVEGEDFLTKYGKRDAIRSFELIVSNQKTHITFEGITLNWPQIPKIPFGMYSHQCMDGYTLPTLKRSTIHSVTPVLPQWGPIKNYDEMKSFWENMYGYKLSEEPGCDLAYVTINYGSSPNQYNFPKYCVLPHPPTVIARVDPFPIIGKFLRDFHLRVGSILGQRIQFLDNKAAFATPQIATLASLTGDSKSFQEVGLTHTVTAPSFPFKDLANYKQEPQETEALKMEVTDLPDISQNENATKKSLSPKEKYIPVFDAKKIKPQMLKKDNNKVSISSILSPDTLERICNVEIKSTEEPKSTMSAAKSVNIENLAETNSLSRANVAQLVEYLLSKDIPVRSKDKKKNVLIEMVQKYLQVNTA